MAARSERLGGVVRAGSVAAAPWVTEGSDGWGAPGDPGGAGGGEGLPAGRRRAARARPRVASRSEAGQFVAIMGPSGSGKSTLLHLLGGLDTPDEGEVELDGATLSALSDDARTRLRRQRIGIVYQAFNLVPVLTVAENIALPAVIAGRPGGDLPLHPRRRDRARRARPPPRQAAVAALRRPAAARRHRPGAVHVPVGPPRRRADGQPRPGVRCRGARPLPRRAARDGPDDRDGHPRSAHRRPRRATSTCCGTARCAPSSTWRGAAAERPAPTRPTRHGRGWCCAGSRSSTPPAPPARRAAADERRRPLRAAEH